MANAVLDGVDGLLLGAETLRGLHPVLTVETVLKLCYAAEAHFDYRLVGWLVCSSSSPSDCASC